MEKNIKLIQLHTIFFGMFFIFPVIILYYHDVLGLNFQQYMIGEAVCSATVVIMEVPTGWISDIWARRSTLIAGTLINILGWMILWKAANFYVMLLAQALIGAGLSFLSGSTSALLYESLLDLSREGEFRRLEGLRQGISFYLMGITAAAGGFLYEWHHTLPMILTWACAIPCLIFAFFIREPSRHQPTEKKHPVADILETVRMTLQGHRDVGGVVMFSALIFAVARLMFRAQQPYFTMIGMPVAWFGVLSAAGMMLGGAGGQFGHWLKHKNGNWGILRDCAIVMFLACLIAGLWPSYLGVALLLTGSFITALGSPSVQEILSIHAPPVRRATVLSAASLMVQMFSVPLMSLSGWATQRYQITGNLILLAGIVLIGIVLFTLSVRKLKTSPK